MRKITTIIAIALFILNVTGCSSNKTNGMPKNITLGGSYSSLEKNYKNEDNDSERFFDILSIFHMVSYIHHMDWIAHLLFQP